MEEIDVSNKVILTYNKNMEYFKVKHKDLFEKIKLFEMGLEQNLIKERYSLEYKNNKYFDVYDNDKDSYLYGEDSNVYSKEIVKKVNFKSKESSFRIFYDLGYDDDVAKLSEKASILSHVAIGNAPITQYVNNNLPKEEILTRIYFYVVFGLGLGTHLNPLNEKINSKLYYLIEPSLELFRLSLFVTDYDALSQKKFLVFSISESKEEFKKSFSSVFYQTHIYNHYIKFFLFSNNCQSYIDMIQNILVSQHHYLFAYNREFVSLKRTYEFIKDDFPIVNIGKNQELELFKNKPVLVLAAGPSLESKIEFVKRNKNKFLIVGVYGIMPILEKYNIKPDVIVQYDESGDIVLTTIQKVKDTSFFSDTLFLFSSHVDRRLISYLKKDNIYIFQAYFKGKKDFGHLTSPSVGEMTYYLAARLGANEVFLLGIDMAFELGSRKSHYDGYESSKAIEDGGYAEDNKNYNLRKNIIKIKGNFDPEVETLPLYLASIMQIEIFIDNNQKLGKNTYNMSNGAFLKGTTPFTEDDFEDRSYNDFKEDKTSIDVLKKTFEDISERNFSSVDIEYNQKKYEDALSKKQNIREIK